MVLRRQDLACDDRMPPLSTFDFSWSNCIHGFYSRWCCCFSCCLPRPSVRGIPAEAALLPVAEQKQLLDAMKGQWVLQKPHASWMREAMFGGGPTGHFQVMLFEQASIDENRLLLTGGSHYPPKHRHFMVQNFPNVRPSAITTAPISQVFQSPSVESALISIASQCVFADSFFSCRKSASSSGARRLERSMSTLWAPLPNLSISPRARWSSTRR